VKILIQDQRGVRALEEGFASEEELQTFLKEHPDLMPLEEIELDAPGLLCIGWEVGLASGAEDILYIDQNGLLTVVETKLRKNPEARREVVGQILEYAAQMSAWSSADVERQAEKFFASDESAKQYRECTLEKAMQIFLESSGAPAEFSYDDFLQQVQTNIERGHFRLVIAIDEPPEPLLKTVEFVNRFSERFDMYLVQLKRFRDLAKEQNIFVPALFGKVATGWPSRQRGRWDENSFFEDVERKRAGQEIDAVRQLYELAKAKGRVQWGTATTGGSFLFQVTKEGRWFTVFNIHANQGMWVSFGSLRRGGVTQDTLEEFRRRLDTQGVAIAEHATEAEWYQIGFPVLAEGKALEVLKDATLWLCSQI
jgi:hypothetical protein